MPLQLGHVVEVHAVDTCDHRGDGGDRHPGGDLAHVAVLLHGDLGEVGIEDVGEQPVVGLHVVDHPQEVVGDVTEEQAHLLLWERRARPVVEHPQRRRQRHGRTAELQDLALEPVDRRRADLVGTGEDRRLDVLEVLLELGVDRDVVVDDAVHHRVHDRDGTVTQAVSIALKALADTSERVGLTASHRDDEPVADEEHHLTGLHVRGLFDVAQGLHHDEDRVVVELDLGPLVALDGVLDRERVELELVVDEVELGVGGVLQPDPEERVGVVAAAQLLEGVAEVATGQPSPLAVDGLVHDHGPTPPRPPRSREQLAVRLDA